MLHIYCSSWLPMFHSDMKIIFFFLSCAIHPHPSSFPRKMMPQVKKTQLQNQTRVVCLVALHSFRTSQELVRARATKQFLLPPKTVKIPHVITNYNWVPRGWEELPAELKCENLILLFLYVIHRWINTKLGLIKASAEFSCPVKLLWKRKAIAA